MLKFKTREQKDKAKKVNASDLKLILLYYFDYEKGVSTWKKDKLAGTIAEKFAHAASRHGPSR
jgi:hypothetical protein